MPDGTPEPLSDLADYAFDRIVDVLNEQVDPTQAPMVLKAAREIRDEICGPVAKKVEVSFSLERLLAEANAPALDVTPTAPRLVGRDLDGAFNELAEETEAEQKEGAAPSGAAPELAD